MRTAIYSQMEKVEWNPKQSSQSQLRRESKLEAEECCSESKNDTEGVLTNYILFSGTSNSCAFDSLTTEAIGTCDISIY